MHTPSMYPTAYKALSALKRVFKSLDEFETLNFVVQASRHPEQVLLAQLLFGVGLPIHIGFLIIGVVLGWLLKSHDDGRASVDVPVRAVRRRSSPPKPPRKRKRPAASSRTKASVGTPAQARVRRSSRLREKPEGAGLRRQRKKPSG